MDIPIYKRFYFFKKKCTITNEYFKGWGYRYLAGPYYSIPNGSVLGHWRFMDGSIANDKDEAYQLIEDKRAKERQAAVERMKSRIPPPPRFPQKTNRKYHPIKNET